MVNSQKFLNKICLIKIAAFLIYLSFSHLLIALDFESRQGMDHGALSRDHVQVADDFINTHFKSDGYYSPEKIAIFIQRLKEEQQSFIEDLIETKKIERLEIRELDPDDGKKKDPSKHKVIKAYTKYLIPKMEQLYELARRNERIEILDAIVADFIRGYNAFYLPNAHRSILSSEDDIKAITQHVFSPYKFKKDDDRPEASNLVVDETHQSIIERCFQQRVDLGHYLSTYEIQALKRCGFDISRLDVGISGYWLKVKPEDRDTIKHINWKHFPQEHETLKFKEVGLGGAGSPKFEAEFKRGDEKIKIKIKMGDETHTEIAASFLGFMVGLNQDPMLYRNEVKVELGKFSFESFKAQLAAKYGLTSIVRLITAHGGEKGKEWIKLRDVAFEGKPEDELRVAAFDMDGWDLQNRREFRGSLIWYAWLGIMDTKPDNFKVIFKEVDNNSFVPLFRLHDPGFSLGSGLHLKRKFNKFFGMNTKYKINDFETEIVERKQKNNEDYVHVWWNDFHNRNRKFSASTWNDLKWMARKIAEIPDSDISWSLRASGIPEEIVELYRHKLVLRRNNLIQAFDLYNEYPLYPVPDLDHYNPNPAIKNGVVVQTSFVGKNDLVVSQNTLASFLAQSINVQVPLADITKQFHSSYEALSKTGFDGLAGLNSELGMKDKVWSPSGNSDKEWSLGAGISVGISRRVSINPQLLSSDGKGRPFVVSDTMYFDLGTHSTLLNKIMDYLPFKIRGGIRIFRKEFEHRHYAETIKQAFLKPFHLFKIMADVQSYVSHQLDTLEVVRVSDAYGLEVGAEIAALDIKNVVSNNFAHTSGWIRSTPVFFSRDQYGLLHIYKEHTDMKFTGTSFVLGNIKAKLVSIPLIGLEFTYNHFFHEGVDYTFELPSYDIRETHAVRKILLEKEVKALNAFFHSKSDSSDLANLHTNFHIQAEGFKKTFKGGFLYYFGRKRNIESATSTVTLSDGQERKFYRYLVERRRLRGLDNLELPGQVNSFIKNSQGSRIILEMDQDDQDNFVMTIAAQDFERKLNRQDLLVFINKLNKKYSESDDTPFYRNFRIPAPNEVDLYRRLYSLTRIHMSGKSLLDAVRNTSEADFLRLVDAHFDKSLTEVSCRRGRMASLCSEVSSHFKLARLKKNFRKLKSQLHGPVKKIQHLGEAAERFIASFYIERYGLKALRNLVGVNNLFVLGNIAGVFDSFSTMERTNQPESDRRFAGKSWGEFKMVPPIRHFLRYGTYLMPNYYLTAGIGSEAIFGTLPTGVPGDY